MEISQDGEYIFIAEFNSTKLHVFSTSLDSIILTIDHGMTKNEDGTISENFYYLVTNNGSVFKIDIESQTIVTQLLLEKTSLAISVTTADEMLYVVTPQDSTAQIIETSTMTRLMEAKVPGDLRRVSTSILNYQ
jgi:DNA-binding beta-propeller fold protein YncE